MVILMEAQKSEVSETVVLGDLEISGFHKCISCGDDLAVLYGGGFVCINNSLTSKCSRYGLVTVITTENKF